MMSSNDSISPQPVRQVVIDNVIVYEGDEWAQVFLSAALNPENGVITYVEDGKPGATFGAPLQQTPLDP